MGSQGEWSQGEWGEWVKVGEFGGGGPLKKESKHSSSDIKIIVLYAGNVTDRQTSAAESSRGSAASSFQEAGNVPQFMSSRRGLSRPLAVLRGCQNMDKKQEQVKKNRKKMSMWEHEVCGSMNLFVWQMWITPMEKADLINAGLGPKKMCLFEYGEAFEFQFHDELLNVYPKLVSAGGYGGYWGMNCYAPYRYAPYPTTIVSNSTAKWRLYCSVPKECCRML